jgi:hypothetical protein
MLNGGDIGFVYVGSLLMGADKQKIDVIYDTGSDWLAVEGANCSNCEGDTFDAQASGVI